MADFIWGQGGTRLTPEDVAAQRKYGQGLLAQGVDYSPIQSPWQGAARMAQALMGGWETGQADYASKQNAAESNAVIQALLGGGAAPAAPTTAPIATTAAPTGAPMAASPMGTMGIPAGKDEFVNSIMPMAQEASAKTGLDPRLIVAQAALESGWGKSAPGNNLFGIKSHGVPGGNTLATNEVVNGQPVSVRDSFRAYASPADSVKGYADFMTQNPRYEPVRAAQGLEAQVAALGQSGYATDPAYAQKVMQIAQGLPAPAGGAPVPSAPAAAARPAINPAIVQAISSPYMSDSAKKIGTMLFQNNLEQQQKASDPLRQAQLAKLQQDLTPLAEPTLDRQGNLVQRDALGKVNVLKAAESRPTSVSEYEYYKANLPQGQQAMPYDTWATAKARAGAMNVTNNVGGGSDKQIFDTFSENTKEARAAANGLVALRSARQALQGPGGAITGFGADEKLTFQKLGAALGVADPAAVQNTETFRAAIAPQVASMLKSTVGSANISNSDREFAEKAAGGSIKLDGGSINRLLDIMEKAGTARLELHNQQLDAVYPDPTTNKRERALFGVQMPAAPPQPEQPPQQPVTNGAVAVNPKTGERRILQNGKWVPVL